MKPETGRFLRKAGDFLDKAQGMLAKWPDEASRAAYLAAFHAAQALIFEQTDHIAKTHSGVRARFSQLVKEDSRFDATLRAFLGRAYNFKAIADYETGQEADIPPEHAADAISVSRRFVDCIVGVIQSGRAG